jgi:hypothetical protein
VREGAEHGGIDSSGAQILLVEAQRHAEERRNARIRRSELGALMIDGAGLAVRLP